MAKKEAGICRICNEYDDTSESFEYVYSFSNVITDIKETLGIEVLVGPDTPTYVCPECFSALENAQKFRQKCIRSNEYYALISALSDRYESKNSEESKFFDTNFDQGTSISNLNLATSTNSDIEKINDEAMSISIMDHEHGDKLEEVHKLSQSTNEQDSTSSTRTKKGVKKKKKTELGRKQRSDKIVAPVICDICGNVFKTKHKFALHLRRHSNNKPYDCELCSSRFYTNSELKRHMRRHTGEKPYECQHCQRKFSDYGTLTKHIRTHTNDRPYPCKQCGKSFSCTFVLKNHMLIHTGERAFRCEICDKSFGRLHNLTTHMKSIYHQRNICIKENKTEVSCEKVKL